MLWRGDSQREWHDSRITIEIIALLERPSDKLSNTVRGDCFFETVQYGQQG